LEFVYGLLTIGYLRRSAAVPNRSLIPAPALALAFAFTLYPILPLEWLSEGEKSLSADARDNRFIVKGSG
jgi:hypothetical protein